MGYLFPAILLTFRGPAWLRTRRRARAPLAPRGCPQWGTPFAVISETLGGEALDGAARRGAVSGATAGLSSALGGAVRRGAAQGGAASEAPCGMFPRRLAGRA